MSSAGEGVVTEGVWPKQSQRGVEHNCDGAGRGGWG